MHFTTLPVLLLSAMIPSIMARPLEFALPSAVQKRSHHRTLAAREVPQEHSHEKFLRQVNALLQLNNPDEIQDAVFGFLGNAAASTGAGNIADPDCLQQATADRAFTNAKEAGDLDGQIAALIFRTLERNTGSVGLKSVLCTSIQAVNPEIARLEQHQDPASAGAAAFNKELTLRLAVEIARLGGDPFLALESGTFEPGQIGDPTAAGNTCNDAEDEEGCIFTENLLVEDASEAEIIAAVEAAGLEIANGNNNNNNNNNNIGGVNLGNINLGNINLNEIFNGGLNEQALLALFDLQLQALIDRDNRQRNAIAQFLAGKQRLQGNRNEEQRIIQLLQLLALLGNGNF